MVDDDDDGGDDDEDDDDGGTAGVQECITRERMERRPRHQRADGDSILSRTGSTPKAHFFNWGINPPKSYSDATEEGARCPFDEMTLLVRKWVAQTTQTDTHTVVHSPSSAVSRQSKQASSQNKRDPDLDPVSDHHQYSRIST